MSNYSQRLRKAKQSKKKSPGNRSAPSLLAGPHFEITHQSAKPPTVADMLLQSPSSVPQADLEAMLEAANKARQEGRTDNAEQLYRAILANKPDHADTLFSLGDLCLEQGNLETAVKLFEQAIAIRPEAALFHIKSAIANARMGALDLACEAGDRAAALRPLDVPTLVQAGRIHLENHHRSIAIDYFDRVVKLDPNNIAAIAAKAHLCEQEAKLQEAQAIVNQHLAHDPGCIPLATTAARLHRRAGNYAEAIQVLERARVANPAIETSPTVQFELGHIHDAAGDYDNAFLAAATANYLNPSHDQTGRISFHDIPEQLASIRASATTEWVDSWSPTPSFPEEQSPIFAFGFPRSGNTLVDRILKCHSQLQAFMEKPMLRDVTALIDPRLGSYTAAIAKLPAEQIERLRTEYFRAADRFEQRDPARRIVDTHPVNTHRVGMMHRLFPTTKYLLVVRHPYDACLSCFLQDFRNPMLRDNSCSLEAIADWYIESAELWKQHCEVLPIRHHVVRYENLVESFDDEVQSLCQYLDIPWEESMRDFNVNARQQGGVTTASYHQVTQQLYRRAKYRWKNYARHLAPILPRLRPYAEQMGYPVD